MLEPLMTKNICYGKTGRYSFLNKIGAYGCLEKMGAVNGLRNKKYGGLRKVGTPIIVPPRFFFLNKNNNIFLLLLFRDLTNVTSI